ncbi:MAG: helix-turn-helix transcriptional regulator [Deltaproteobacteria bacterium]|nr:helix-turn-helix transcriptional regulator [Deltaproteobacteria bacterium]
MIKYTTLRHETVDIELLPKAHKTLFLEVSEYYRQKPSWVDFQNFWLTKITGTLAKKLTRAEIIQTAIYKICQDMDSRLGIEQGYIRQSDYRDILAMIIYKNYSSRYQFCKEVGIDEAFLSNVLNKKKSFSIENLEKILAKIGYEIEIRKKTA